MAAPHASESSSSGATTEGNGKRKHTTAAAASTAKHRGGSSTYPDSSGSTTPKQDKHGVPIHSVSLLASSSSSSSSTVSNTGARKGWAEELPGVRRPAAASVLLPYFFPTDTTAFSVAWELPHELVRLRDFSSPIRLASASSPAPSPEETTATKRTGPNKNKSSQSRGVAIKGYHSSSPSRLTRALTPHPS
jgi:hypothetical protein